MSGVDRIRAAWFLFFSWLVPQELELDEFITHRMGFDEINRALNLLAQGKCLRCIIWMDDGAAKEDGA